MQSRVTTLVMTALLAAACAGGQTAAKKEQTPQRAETFLHKVLRISGIAASPTALKGPGDETKSGRIWVFDIATKKAQSITASGGYRSPIVAPNGQDILALRGGDVVRVRLPGKNAEKLYTIPGINKLVGFSQDDTDKVLILMLGRGADSTVGLLSVGTGKVEPVPYDSASSEDRQMLEHLRSGDRVYGDKSVYVKRSSKESVAGSVQWTDVFLKLGAAEAINVSECDEVNCGQPSLAPDGRLVVFLKAQN